jgi:hypothetical protein
MSDTKTEYDWSAVNGHAVERLRAPKVTPVPERLVALAQASWDGVPNPNYPAKSDVELLHVLRHQFGTVEAPDEARAQAFAKLMTKAGDHTVPETSVTVVIDPDYSSKAPDIKNPGLVAWKAGTRRGRKTT